MDGSGYLKDLSSQLISLKDLAAKRVQELETLVPEVKALKKKYSNKFGAYVNYISQYKTKIKNDFQQTKNTLENIIMDTCCKTERQSRQEMNRLEEMTTKATKGIQDFQDTQKETFEHNILKEVQEGISNMEECARHNFTQIDENLQLGWQCVKKNWKRK